MVIAKMQTPPDDVAFAQRMQIYRTKDAEVAEETEAARMLIGSIIEDASTPSDNVALGNLGETPQPIGRNVESRKVQSVNLLSIIPR